LLAGIFTSLVYLFVSKLLVQLKMSNFDARMSDAPDLLTDPSLYPDHIYAPGELERRRSRAKRQLNRAGKIVVYNNALGHRSFWVEALEGFLPRDVQVSGRFGPTGVAGPAPSPLFVRAAEPYAGNLGTLHPGHNLDIIDVNINELNTLSNLDVSLRYNHADVVEVFIKPRS